ncbi:hypothetical protein H5410_040561 [Solanum commersonii]|uniref:Uncharacterized protein n=1 Tax=Solanum commersonii TaxID=4109 RepID=A0A9J5XR89_SOLCO|nr:hypothetical protein H5410_040561 [Solanum commersonii]
MAALDKNIDLFDVFHMKPLKIENEVDSNMKSTIRYTFVAPGNLPSKSILPQSSDLVKKYIKEFETRKYFFRAFCNLYFILEAKSILPQSSNLVKKYIKEIETSKIFCILLPQTISKFFNCLEGKYFFPAFCLMQNIDYIGKGRGQGLKNSTMSTSQGIRMMHKNSMDFEKENMQINTFSPTSTNQVKKYTQEIETMGPGAIKKGLEKRTESLSSTLGISKYEVGSFNKSVVCANVTPTKCTKSSSTMPSSHEM